MFWNRKSKNESVEPRPLGVPLDELLACLQPTTIRGELAGNALLARHEHFATRVEVVPPEPGDSANGPIRAVVRLTTELPAPLQDFVKALDAAAGMNCFAALGALTSDGGKACIGSRLTIYEAEDAWRTLHMPLLLFAIIGSAESLLGAARRAFSDQEGPGGESAWTEQDMEQVHRYLSQMCVCNAGGLGFTAEFGLEAGATAAPLGHRTALFRLLADEPHPEAGGGLLCLLEMPHRIEDAGRLSRVCAQLNKMEMAAHDLPPHFGAWCEGRLGSNPAYVSFLPNGLHTAAPGIAVNSAIWAASRAQWANAMLAALGVRTLREGDGGCRGAPRRRRFILRHDR